MGENFRKRQGDIFLLIMYIKMGMHIYIIIYYIQGVPIKINQSIRKIFNVSRITNVIARSTET